MPRARLSSVRTAVAELTLEVTALAEQENDAGNEDLAHRLYEVERSLQAAGRRLEVVLRGLR